MKELVKNEIIVDKEMRSLYEKVKSYNTFESYLEHCINFLYWNYARVAFYIGEKRYTSSPSRFDEKASKSWKSFSSVTQLDNKVRLYPLKKENEVIGYIVVKTDSNYFDSLIQIIQKDLLKLI